LFVCYVWDHLSRRKFKLLKIDNAKEIPSPPMMPYTLVGVIFIAPRIAENFIFHVGYEDWIKLNEITDV
jgi:hypothetical protein